MTDWKTRAERIVRDAVEPTLVAAGFEGEFPYYHRLGKQAVECVSIDVFVRGGVRVYLMSLAHRSALGKRSARQDVVYAGRHPSPTDARRIELVSGVLIDSPSRLKAIPSALSTLGARLRDDGRAFWNQHDADVELRALRQQITDAVEAGDLAGVRRALAGARSPRIAQDALQIHLRNWNDDKAIERVFRVAPAIVEWKPRSFILASMLTAGAAKLVGKHPKQAEAVLAWVKPHLRKVKWLAGQIALHADIEANARRFAPALTLYELVLGLPDVSAQSSANALWTAMADNNGQPVDRARHERFMKRALAAHGDDPIVHFNAACLQMELERPDRALRELGVALERGLDPAKLATEELFAPLRTDPRFAKLARAKQRKVESASRFRG